MHLDSSKQFLVHVPVSYHTHSANTQNTLKEFITRGPVKSLKIFSNYMSMICMLIKHFRRHKRVFPVYNAMKSKVFQNV